MFLKAPGFELVGGDLDLRIQQSLLDYPWSLIGTATRMLLLISPSTPKVASSRQ
jgi:hypothetical protein